VIFAPPVTDYRARTKVALSLLGVIESISLRPPLLPLDEAECGRVQQALAKAGLVAERV
jgi:dihydrodipicolinate synthase/N-acetylneuraminate lyase